MHVGALNKFWAIKYAHSPLVPNFRLRIITPNLDSHFLTFRNNKWSLDREVHREPTVHSRSMLFRFNTIENVLIKFSCKVASKSMQFSFCFLHDEDLAIIATQVLFTTLRE